MSIRATIDAIWRIESPRLIGGLTRIVRDVGLAEDLAQDALVAALEQWPESGVPDNPGAWLMATAKHRAIDIFRRTKRTDEKHAELGRAMSELHGDPAAALNDALDAQVGDDVLRLIFIACHPVLSAESRVALTLAACHARALQATDTDWMRIAVLYAQLWQLTPSPVIELNRAVAVGMAVGPAAGLAIVDELTSEPSLRDYHLLPSVRGDLLMKLGRLDEARAEFERASSMTRNERERKLLLARALSCGQGRAQGGPPLRRGGNPRGCPYTPLAGSPLPYALASSLRRGFAECRKTPSPRIKEP